VLHDIYTAHLKTPQAREEIDELSALVKQSGPVCISAMSAIISTVTAAGSPRPSKTATELRWKI
jgi:hypothetical protein